MQRIGIYSIIDALVKVRVNVSCIRTETLTWDAAGRRVECLESRLTVK